MSDEPTITAAKRYTLDEAARELARQECAHRGHSWDVIETLGHGPVAIVCNRCGRRYKVVDDA